MILSGADIKIEKSKIFKIVITGGPCAGKTSAVKRICDEFTAKGYSVLTVKETATELITSGITPKSFSNSDTFQYTLMRLQFAKEKLFFEAAEKLRYDGKVLVVCDRGLLDGKAYTSSEKVFEEMLKESGLDTRAVFLRYDAVFHLSSAAKGDASFYTLATNCARMEEPKEAALLDDRIVALWKDHPYFKTIGNDVDFEKKLNRLIKEISVFLGESLPTETERKFLIEYPDTASLRKNPLCKEIYIEQTYLVTDKENEEIRVRKKTENGITSYVKTVKKPLTDMTRVEIEDEISYEDYIIALLDADKSKRPICKTRFVLPYNGKTFEIDVYDFWKDKAIMEIELDEESDEFDIPQEIKVIREVTGEKKYKNKNLASLQQSL